VSYHLCHARPFIQVITMYLIFSGLDRKCGSI
jgi:hypothetical protein